MDQSERRSFTISSSNDLTKNSTLNKNVFFSSVAFIAIITIAGSIWPQGLGEFFKEVQGWLIAKTSWVYVVAMGTLLFMAIWLMVSRYGDIKLGPDESTPDYGNISWFAMLFSAGMGIGLLFFGVAEPIMHFASPPVGEGLTVASAMEGMKITFFHWGLHAWAVYAIFAVILAYFCYRKKLPLLPRSAFYPFLGQKIYGKAGDIVDTFAVIGTMFGVATSLGFGVSQVNAGLSYMFGIPQGAGVQVGLIAGITALATISVVAGLDGGIKKLSNANIILAVALMALVLVLGDSMGLMKSYVQNTGAYLSDIVYKTFNLYAYEKKESWIGGWTLLYWGWWISWSPFVGMFIARISRGRTIREFMSGVLFVPTGFTFLWMTIFGNSAIAIALRENGKELVETVNSNVPVALFKFFEYLPLSGALSAIGLMLVVTFFVSSSDSGSLVIDTLTSGGEQEPPVWQRVFWAVTEGVVAATLLLAGGLEALQTMTIASAFPMIFLILVGCLGLIKSLRSDDLLKRSVQGHHTSITYDTAAGCWKERLESLVNHPDQDSIAVFLKDVARPALTEIKDEMAKRSLHVELSETQEDSISNCISLTVKKGAAEDFSYQIKIREYAPPIYQMKDPKPWFRAEVFLRNGGQDYNVYGYTKEQIVADVLTQYERHFHYLHVHSSEAIS